MTLDSLNPEQRAAVTHVEGPILVLAGAGSGKTRVLTTRIARLIEEHGVAPERILAVTFTNKAAGEMRERIHRLLGREPRGAWLGTFHSLGARILRRHADRLGWDPTFTIFDAEASLREIERAMGRVDVDPKRFKSKAVRAVISDAKNQLIPPSRFTDEHGESFDLFLRATARVYPEYQRSLREQNAFDFDDLLVKPVELFTADLPLLERYQERFAFVLVDEFQDTNQAQFRFLELLARVHRNLMVVGDDDQSIYGWRGADIRNILDFERTFEGAAVVRLERNYRSTGTILQAANQVIGRNLQRKAKTLRTDREEGEPILLVETADERDEASWIAGEIETRLAAGELSRYRDAAVLYRTNAQSRALEDAFRRVGIPYQIVGGVRFYERREIQDLLAYLRLISNPLDAAAFERAVNLPRRGVGKSSLDRFLAWAREQGISPLEAAGRVKEVAGVSTGAARGIEKFSALIHDFAERARRMEVGPLIEELVTELDLSAHLREEGPEGDDRIENVRELIAGAMEFDAGEVDLDDALEAASGIGVGAETPTAEEKLTDLDHFLQQVALITDIDRSDPDSDAVMLMTLHNAKGLEFPSVFLSGLEDGLFPLGRAYDDLAQLEEERRLMYVGITRAENRLSLSWARERRRGGDLMVGRLSSFVEDIPSSLVVRRRSPAIERRTEELRGRSRSGEYGGFGGGSRRGWENSFGGGIESRRKEARPPSIEEDLAHDDEMNQDLPRMVRGERVVHGTFGSGTVVEVVGTGKDVKVVVDFRSVGRKRLLAAYAGLEKDY